MSISVQFFTALYKCMTGVLELRTFGKEGDSDEAKRQRNIASKLRAFIPVDNGAFKGEKVDYFVDRCNEEGMNAYYGVALRTRESLKMRKGDTAHCQVLTALFVDADYKHLGEAETRKRIAEFPLKPSIVVKSGGGLHPYWKLEEPIHLKAKDGLKTAKAQLRHLASSVADVVDESVSEPARVLRIPGSTNFKKEYGEPRTVSLESCSGRVYTLKQFQEAIGKPPTVAAPTGYSAPDTIAQGDRHDALYRLLRSQKARNVNKEVAIDGCHSMNKHQCKPPIETKSLDAYLRRVWDQPDDPEFAKHKADGEARLYETPPPEGASRRHTVEAVPFTEINSSMPDHIFGRRFFRGSTTLLVGEGAVGKGFQLADIAAGATTGRTFPDAASNEYLSAVNVGVMLTEDKANTFKSRFMTAGGDPTRLFDLSAKEVVDGVTIKSPIFFEEDMSELNKTIEEHSIQFLIIETVLEHFGNRSGKRMPNTANELEVRNQIRRVNSVAEHTNIYCVAVMHPRKGSEGKALEAVAGSAGFVNMARSVVFCYLDPATEDAPAEENPVRLLCAPKANYSKKVPSTLRFKVESWDPLTNAPCVCNCDCDHQGRVVWQDPLVDGRTAQEITDTYRESQKQERSAPSKEKAIKFLESLTEDGFIHLTSRQLIDQATEQGIGAYALRAARKQLNVKADRASEEHGKARRFTIGKDDREPSQEG